MRADDWLCRPRPDRDTHAAPRNDSTAPRGDLPLPNEVIDHGLRENGYIEGVPALQLSLEHRGGAIFHAQPVMGALFEAPANLLQ